MKDKDQIKELFSEKLGNYEAKVNPELWKGVATQIGAKSATGLLGLSSTAKWIAGVVLVGSAIVATALLLNLDEEKNEVVQNESPENLQSRTKENKEVEDKKDVKTTQSEAGWIEVEEKTSMTDSHDNALVTSKEETIIINDKEIEPVKQSDLEIKKEKTNNLHKEKENQIPPSLEINDPAAENVQLIEEFEAEIQQNNSKSYTIDKLPNIITPNGDRVNDFLEIKSEGLTGFTIIVLNDENQVVYQSKDPNFKWNGVDLAGNPVPEGNYIYVITANEFESDKPKRMSPLRIVR